MAKIRFIGDEAIYSVDMSVIDKRVILKSNDKISKTILKNGFEELNEHNSLVQADYSSYKYIYKEDDNGTITLTSEESDVYTEPTVPDTSTQFPDTYEPTLEELKNQKISHLSNVCNKMIIAGITVMVNGIAEKFSYTESDQTNLKELFDTVLSTGLPVYYHADDMGCKAYTSEQIISIYIAQATNKTHHTTYFNQLKLYINNLNDKNLVSDVEYGVTELSGEYLSTYNSAMTQAELNISSYLAKYGVNYESIN